jgi:rod shape-determining protein MreB
VVSGLGVDFGTSTTLLCHTRRGIVWQESTVLALPSSGGRGRVRPVAVGDAAAELLERTPEGLIGLRPMEDSVVADLDAATSFLSCALRAAGAARLRLLKPRSLFAVPAGATPLERRALLEVAGKAGFGQVILVPSGVAAAVGCGMDPLDATAHMVVDIGGGTAEMTAFCQTGLVVHRSSRIAGEEMTLALQAYLRERHHLTVSRAVAEQVKIEASREDGPSILARGLDSATGRPSLVTVAVEEVTEAVRPVTEALLQILASCMQELPARVVSDVMEEGILAVGGGSLMANFDKLLESSFGFGVIPAQRPLTCVSEGAARCLQVPGICQAYGLRA